MGDAIMAGPTNDKLIQYSGLISATIKDSESLVGLQGLAYGISNAPEGTPFCGGSPDKLMLLSFPTTQTLKTSTDVSAIDINPMDISADENGHTPWLGTGADKLYMGSGRFETTMKDSLEIGGKDTWPRSISYSDGHTPWQGAVFGKWYLYSGQVENTIKTSHAYAPKPGGGDRTGAEDGYVWCATVAKKGLYTSGEFSATVKDSISTSGVLTTPEACSETDFQASASSGADIFAGANL